MLETRIFCDRTVTPDGVIAAELLLKDGQITAVDHRMQASANALDWTGDTLIPGLVDIHTDNLEKHYMPRQGAQWDSFGAALAHDAQCATAGITTVLDSLSLHGEKNGLDRGKALGDMLGGVNAAREAGALKADHLLHLRCEVSKAGLMELLEPYLAAPTLTLVSLMDHAPGQRSAGGLEGWRAKHRKHGKTDAEIQAHFDSMTAWRDMEGAPALRRRVARAARSMEIPLASHDDSAIDHVEEAIELGVSICEFPTTLDAARRAFELGLVNVMGAPNFVRGRSHGDNASAREVASEGLLHALCSDYVPLSMIRAAFQLTEPPFSWPLARAIDVVSGAPARMCNLHDRGAISAGLRADIVRVRVSTGWPVPLEVWRTGTRVA